MLTVYGIETKLAFANSFNSISDTLQQCLPFTVLKHRDLPLNQSEIIELQQCLPFTVLKPKFYGEVKIKVHIVATVLTVYGIETVMMLQT